VRERDEVRCRIIAIDAARLFFASRRELYAELDFTWPRRLFALQVNNLTLGWQSVRRSNRLRAENSAEIHPIRRLALFPGMNADEATKLRQVRLERRESGAVTTPQ
jgi:hypothetical protein